MRVDRGEAQGTAIAFLLHVALVVALTMNLASPPVTPEPPPLEVEMVDSEEVALTAAAPQQAAPSPPAASPAPAEPSPAPPEPQPAPAPPSPQPAPAPPPPAPIVRPAPTPLEVARPTPVARPAPARPSPPQARPAPTRPAPARPAPARPGQPRQSRLGDDFLGPAPARPAPPRQSRLGGDFLAGVPDAPAAQQGAATFSAAAKASVDQAIKRQIQPCADRQPALGPGADRIRVVLNLRLDPSGRLSRAPSLIDVRGLDDENRAFEDLAYNQAVAVFRACSPLRLPPDLYSTPQGGWGNITMTYRAK